ncbi:MAG: (2Fe-2S) ferredoxin domain-containing protein [Bdellovibrionota bacterium]
MSLYEKHLFICENEREPKNPLGCCASKGSKEITAALKKRCNEAGLKGKVRINKAGCLGQCEKGAIMVVYPEGTWYQNVTLADVDEIFEENIQNNRVVERLQLKK